MRALVTGVSGFAGSHLAELLLARGVEVWGIVQPGVSSQNLDGIREASGGGLHPMQADILQEADLLRIVQESRADRVFHLAASASVRRSLDDPRVAFQVNVLGTRNLLEAIRRAAMASRVLVVGSAEAYGESARLSRSLREDDPLLPVSPYGTSKAAVEAVASRYGKGYGLHVVCVRPFPHCGPRQAPQFALPDWARQLAEIEAGARPPRLLVGNLTVRRDLSDVRDVVRAYTLALESGQAGSVYNVCSGRVYGLRDVLEALIRSAHRDVEVVADSQRLRPHDLEVLAGSADALRACTGWEAAIPLEKTLHDLMGYWRAEVRSGRSRRRQADA